ncbi:MAG: outer membrane beta-barrel protein [Flavobacteriaceae bacterium]
MMKNTFLLILLVCLTHTTLKAQDLTYGVMLGANFKNIEVEGDGLNAGAAYSDFKYTAFPVDMGGYIDYGFDEAFGIKANLFYGRTVHEYSSDPGSLSIHLMAGQVTLQPMLKYDVNKEYGKGFYLLAGPRASFVISSKFEDSDLGDADGFYKGSNFGAGIGFGFTFSKTIGFEMMGDYGLSNLLDSSDWKTETAGASVNLYVNLESLLNK